MISALVNEEYWARATGRGHLANHVEGGRTEELALAIEVRGDDDTVGLLSQVLERANELFLGRQLNDGRPGEIGQALELPALDGDTIGKKRLALGVVGRAGISPSSVTEYQPNFLSNSTLSQKSGARM